MFNFLVGLVNSPQFALETVDFALCYGATIAEATEELLLFNADMMAQMSSI